MSSSSSDSGAGAPSDDILEEALIRAVKDMYKSEKLEDLTIKRVRKAAELDLELEEDFYKSDEKWKEKSRDVISKAVVCELTSALGLQLVVGNVLIGIGGFGRTSMSGRREMHSPRLFRRRMRLHRPRSQQLNQSLVVRAPQSFSRPAVSISFLAFEIAL